MEITNGTTTDATTSSAASGALDREEEDTTTIQEETTSTTAPSSRRNNNRRDGSSSSLTVMKGGKTNEGGGGSARRLSFFPEKDKTLRDSNNSHNSTTLASLDASRSAAVNLALSSSPLLPEKPTRTRGSSSGARIQGNQQHAARLTPHPQSVMEDIVHREASSKTGTTTTSSSSGTGQRLHTSTPLSYVKQQMVEDTSSNTHITATSGGGDPLANSNSSNMDALNDDESALPITSLERQTRRNSNLVAGAFQIGGPTATIDGMVEEEANNDNRNGDNDIVDESSRQDDNGDETESTPIVFHHVEAELVSNSKQFGIEELTESFREQVRAEVQEELLGQIPQAAVVTAVSAEGDAAAAAGREATKTASKIASKLGSIEKQQQQSTMREEQLRFHRNIPIQGRQSEVDELQSIYNCLRRRNINNEDGKQLQEKEKAQQQRAQKEREKAQQQNQKAKQELKYASSSSPPPRMVLVGGPAGVGKTRLVKEALLSSSSSSSSPSSQTTTNNINNCCCFYGKYDKGQQKGGGQPYSGIVTAYNSICEYVLRVGRTSSSSSSGSLPTLCLELQQLFSLGQGSDYCWDDELICKMIPALKQLLSINDNTTNPQQQQQHSNNTDPTASVDIVQMAQHRLNFLLHGLTRILSQFLQQQQQQQQQPLVLILDDLMWADEASLKLLSELASDQNEIPHLLIVGTYRSDDEKKHTSTGTTTNVNDNSSAFGGGSHRNDGSVFGGSRGSRGSNRSRDNSMFGSRMGEKSRSNRNNADNTVFGSWLHRELDDDDDDETTTAITKKIELKNLSVMVVQTMIQEMLDNATTINPTAAEACQLARVVHRKTLGNPFFVIQFVQNLIDRKLVTYDTSRKLWTWDKKKIDDVECTFVFLDGVLRAKLERLDPTTQFVAQVGSCLGFSFSFILLLMGIRSLELEDVGTEAIVTSLQTLLSEGIVERRASCDEVVYFANDQIQQAAFDMIPHQNPQLWQATIGQAILNNSDPLEVEQRLFLITDLINKGISMMNNGGTKLVERERIIELNHRAGKKSMANSAFVVATTYLQTAISLLGKSCWGQDERSRTLDLYCTAAESEYCNANFDDMQKQIDTVLNRDEVAIDFKLRPYIILMKSLNTRNKCIDAIDLGEQVLRMVQGKQVLPSKASDRQVLTELKKTMKATSQKPVEKLANLPLLDDEKKLYTNRIIDLMITATYTSKPELFQLLPLYSVQSSVRHGIGTYSAPSFAAYAIVLCGKLGELREGYKMGRVAMAVQERLPNPGLCRAWTHFMFYAFVAHWVIPAETTIERLEEGYQLGMALGDVDNAILCKVGVATHSLHCGKGLLSLVQIAYEAESILETHVVSQSSIDTLLPLWQFALNLMGQSNLRDPLVLTGDVMNEEAFLKQAGDVKYLVSLVYGLRLQLAYILGGDNSLLEDLYKKTKDLSENLCGTVQHQRHVLYDGMVSFLLADRMKKQKNKWLNRGKEAKKLVEQWVEQGDVNSTHVSFLLSAEFSFVAGKHVKAEGLFQQAIHISKNNGFLQDCALAYERSGINYLRMGDEHQASEHLTKAHETYLIWGATAKGAQLIEQYGDTRIRN